MDYGIPTELITPRRTLVLNDYASPAHYRISGVPDEGAPIRGVTEPRPGIDGSDILAPSLRGHRLFNLRGQITLDDRIRDALAIRRRMMDDWSAAMEELRGRDGTLRWLPRGAWNHSTPLTVAGNEMTDALRALGVQGDGLLGDGSIGVWPAAQNLVPNGGFETNTISWAAHPSHSIRVSTLRARFGLSSLLVTRTGVGTQQGAYTQLLAVPAGTYTASLYVWIPATFDGTDFRLYIDTFTGVTATWVLANLALRDQWQRLNLTVTSTGTSNGYVQAIQSGGSNGSSFWIDGVQFEAGTIATPYVHTDGAPVARAAGRLRAPAAALSTDQGWAAFRVRMHVPAPVGGHAIFWEWLDSAAGYNQTLGLDFTGTAWRVDSTWDGGTPVIVITADTVTDGALRTVIVAWTPTHIRVSAGGAFATAYRPRGATATPGWGSLFDLLSRGGSSLFSDAELLWALFGNGTLTDTDAATLAALQRDPYPNGDLPAAASVIQAITGDDLYQNVPGWRRATVQTWDAPPPKGDLLKEFQAQLLAASPEVVADTLQTADTGALGGSVTIVNAGKARAYPTLRLYGPFTAATIRNATTNQSIVIVYTVAAGHYLEIDTKLQTIRYDGSALAPVDSAANPATTIWWGVEPGTNVITWTGAGGSGAEHAQITWRDTWQP